MQHTDLMRPDEDWRQLADASERRKIQNRIAQRAYRRNMRDRLNKIEQLTKQLRAYEELNLGLHIARNGESTSVYQQQQHQSSSSSPSTLQVPLPHENRGRSSGGCSPPSEWEAMTSSLHLPIGAEMEMDRDGNGIAKSDAAGVPVLPLSAAELSPMADEHFAPEIGDWTAESQSQSLKRTPLLHMAVAGNHLDTVKVLLQDERVLIDEEDSEGFTAVQRAVMHGRSKIVKLLLEHQAKTDPGPGSGRGVDSPL
ncbi:hypothetical protein AKAW_10249 [Aspergillus luchuensis IFO 4308]|nr:hypothetical protein AKAW_10249 [Aspergillus luchuensis IFO 4308]